MSQAGLLSFLSLSKIMQDGELTAAVEMTLISYL